MITARSDSIIPTLLPCRAYRCPAASAEGLPRTWQRMTSNSSRAIGRRWTSRHPASSRSAVAGGTARTSPPRFLPPRSSRAQYKVDWDEYYADDRSRRAEGGSMPRADRLGSCPRGSRSHGRRGWERCVLDGRGRVDYDSWLTGVDTQVRRNNSLTGRSDDPRRRSRRRPKARSMRSRSGMSMSTCGRMTCSSIRSGAPSRRMACS